MTVVVNCEEDDDIGMIQKRSDIEEVEWGQNILPESLLTLACSKGLIDFSLDFSFPCGAAVVFPLGKIYKVNVINSRYNRRRKLLCFSVA